MIEKDEKYLLNKQYVEKSNLQNRIDFQTKYGGKNYIYQLKKMLQASNSGTILDMGCGTGWMWEHLMEDLPFSHIVFCDFSQPLVGECKNKFSGHSRKLFFIAGNCLAPPFKNECFSMVTLFDVIHHFHMPDLKKVFSLLADILEDKGQLMLTMSSTEHMKSVYDLIERFMTPYKKSAAKDRQDIHSFIKEQSIFNIIQRKKVAKNFEPSKKDLENYVKSMWSFHELDSCAQEKVLTHIQDIRIQVTTAKIIYQLEKA